MRQRLGMGMIELIFAIVIIGITLLSIPAMMMVMTRSSEMTLSQELYGKLYAMVQRKALNPWDASVVSAMNANEAGTILWVPADVGALRCGRTEGATTYRLSLLSSRQCNETGRQLSAIPAAGNGNGAGGIELYNGYIGDSNLTVQVGPTTLRYAVSYVIDYVNDNVANAAVPIQGATWTLGAIGAVPVATAAANGTHLKRLAVIYTNQQTGDQIVYTLFMSNVGVVQ